jgi:hypothetical protein
MSLRERLGIATLGVFVALAVTARTHAAEVTVDDFGEADKTQIIPGTQVVEDTQGESNTATDTNLMGVLGGVRELTVFADMINGGAEEVNAGVEPLAGLCYQSSDFADGRVGLLYDRGGLGLLNVDLHHAQGIQIDIGGDAAAVPYVVTVMLTDDQGNTAMESQTIPDACPPAMLCKNLQFAFTNFLGVNLRRISSIKVIIDPDQAGDLFVGPIMTYGTPEMETDCDDDEDNDNNGLTDCADPKCEKFIKCINTAPTMSSGMLGALIASLGMVGLAGMWRELRGRSPG